MGPPGRWDAACITSFRAPSPSISHCSRSSSIAPLPLQVKPHTICSSLHVNTPYIFTVLWLYTYCSLCPENTSSSTTTTVPTQCALQILLTLQNPAQASPPLSSPLYFHCTQTELITPCLCYPAPRICLNFLLLLPHCQQVVVCIPDRPLKDCGSLQVWPVW